MKCKMETKKKLEERRCWNCAKLLFKAIGTYAIEVRCPRCKEFVVFLKDANGAKVIDKFSEPPLKAGRQSKGG